MSDVRNPDAPAYEPEKWNDRVSPDDLRDFMKKHNDSILKIAMSGGKYSLQEVMRDNPLRVTKDAIEQINKEMERDPDTARIAVKYGLPEAQVKQFASAAEAIYLAQGFQDYSNCYSYAMNDADRYSRAGDSPGQRASGVPGAVNHQSSVILAEPINSNDPEAYKKAIIGAVVADGATDGGPDAPPKAGHYRVAVFVSFQHANGVTRKSPDYHFVREDADGGWSHKFGTGAVNRLDGNGKPIVDPKTAHLPGYEMISMVYVPKGGLDVGSIYEPRSKPGAVEAPATGLDENRQRMFNEYASPYPERVAPQSAGNSGRVR